MNLIGYYFINVQSSPKCEPLPNYQKIVLNRIMTANYNWFLREIKVSVKH